MSKYRYDLPQLQDRLFMTDGGLETTLVFHNGIDLPYFAAFDLLKDDEGTLVLHKELGRYAEVARTHDMGLVLESPTWRANSDWAGRLGYGAAELADANRKAIALLLRIRTEYEAPHTPVVVSGN
ncbi:MAG: homocysteine S-methyltransferase, partial [Pseudomonadota bacterium]|nr:homocysteine S-methyltransferase [Pseudomonadota bacterium]